MLGHVGQRGHDNLNSAKMGILVLLGPKFEQKCTAKVDFLKRFSM